VSLLSTVSQEDIKKMNPIKPISKWHKQILSACEKSFEFFCIYIGKPPAFFHLEWTDFFFNNKDTVILAPRNHAKSTWIRLMCAWIMLFPDKWRKHFNLSHEFLQLAFITSTDEIGVKWMREFHLEFKNWLKRLWLENQIIHVVENTKTVQLNNGSKLEMTAIMGSIRGIRGHFTFKDDLMKDKGMKIDDVKEIHQGAIIPIEFPDSINVLLGTARADNDIMFTALKNAAYVGKLYKAINERTLEDGTVEEYPLWDIRPLKWLYNQKIKMTPVTFSREYMNEPVSDEFALMPLPLLQSCNDYDLKLRRRGDGAYYMGVDLARSATTDADYTVIIVFEVIKEYQEVRLPVVVIRDIWVFHGSEVEDITLDDGTVMKEPFYRPLIRQLKMWTTKYRPQKVYIENNAFQETIVQMVKDPKIVGSVKIPAEGYTTKKADKYAEEGIPIIRSMLQSRRLIFPFGDSYSAEKMGSLQDELQKWVENPVTGKFECTAEHDDRSMALYVGLKGTLSRIDDFIRMRNITKPSFGVKKELREEANQIIVPPKDYDPKKQILIHKPTGVIKRLQEDRKRNKNKGRSYSTKY